MRVEVVAVGSELLLGQIVDTNSSWIGEQLALSGLDCHRQTKVGDNAERIVDCIKSALARAEAVVVCGGLGPTQDDLTRQCLATIMGEPLEEDEQMVERIIGMFAGRARAMSMNNLQQACKPPSARFIEQQPGTAPGLICPVEVDGQEKVVYAVPGVPWEMKEMMLGTVLGDLRERSGDTSVILSRSLLSWGLAESTIAELLDDRIRALDQDGEVTLAFLASGIEGIKVRITTKAADRATAMALLDAEEIAVRERIGHVLFGVDDETMESVVLALMADRGLTLGIAESLTGGLVSSRLVAVPGASAVLRGAVVSYDSAVKFDLLGVPEGPVITEEAALAMAAGARRTLGSDVGLATTGVAGPEPQEGHKPGTVCLAVDGPYGAHSFSLRLPGRRQQVRDFACISVLDALRRYLLAAGPG